MDSIINFDTNLEIKTGAEAIKRLLSNLNVEMLVEFLNELVHLTKSKTEKKEITDRIRILNQFIKSKTNPS